MEKLIVNGKTLHGVVFATENVVVQLVQLGTDRKKCLVIGSGHSLDIDENCVITRHDPGMFEFKPKVSKKDTVFLFYFTFKCSGLDSAGKELAIFLSSCVLSRYRRVFLVGHSKCGLCFYNARKYFYFIPDESIYLVTISTPFYGTFVADKNEVEERLKDKNLLMKIYSKFFSYHNVDKDIIPNSEFIRNIERRKYKNHINITSSLNSENCKGVIDRFLYLWDKSLNVKGDGIVPLISQIIECPNNKHIHLFCSHAKSLELGLDVIKKM